MPIQFITGLATGGLLKKNGHEEPYCFEDGRFSCIRIFETQSLSNASGDTTGSLQTALTAAPPMGEVLRLVCEALMRKLAKAMMIELEDLDSSRLASSYGVDSVVAVEVRR